MAWLALSPFIVAQFFWSEMLCFDLKMWSLFFVLFIFILYSYYLLLLYLFGRCLFRIDDFALGWLFHIRARATLEPNNDIAQHSTVQYLYCVLWIL